MLHIKKNPPSPAVIRSVAEIKSLPSWRHAIYPGDIREHFDYLNKDAIRACLLEEQHGLCAYCMKRISYDGQVTSISTDEGHFQVHENHPCLISIKSIYSYSLHYNVKPL